MSTTDGLPTLPPRKRHQTATPISLRPLHRTASDGGSRSTTHLLFGSVIDLHCHALWNIDDGPGTIEDSLALARAAAAVGTRTIVATPHISRRYPNDAEPILRLVDGLNQRLNAAGIALDILPGAEIAMTHIVDMEPTQFPLLGLGSGPWLLIEPPFTAVATGLDLIATSLMRSGHRVVIAHPERCPAFHSDPSMLTSLVRAGAVTSVTAGSLVGRFGEPVRRFALELADANMLHNVASDAHDTARRPPGMAAEIEQAGLASLTEWLTRAVPAAIVDGEETIPPQPPGPSRTIQAKRRWLPARH